MSFLGVYKAVYSYSPQNDQELAIEEDDILYLLEKSDIDDWWTVKKRVVGSDVEEPTGLVPSNYIEPAVPIAQAIALYDYQRQTDEEITFNEGDKFEIYDDKDPDWILVSKNDTEFGFVPSNYIENTNGTSSQSLPAILPPPSHPSVLTQKVNVEQQTFQAPPQRLDRETQEDTTPPLPTIPRPLQDGTHREEAEEEEEVEGEELPPPKPARPSQSTSNETYYQSSFRNQEKENDGYEDSNKRLQQQNDDADDGELYTWQVNEVDGRKKRKAMLAIGNSMIYFSPDQGNGTPQQWRILDLISYSSEKKHVFLELKNPLYSLELHAGSKDTASEILNILSELKGASNASGLKEVRKAAASTPSKNQGRIKYDFQGESSNELTVHENDIVNIINDKKSQDWWLVQNSITGTKGIVPAQFVEPIEGKSSSSKLSSFFGLNRSKSKDNLKSPSKSPSKAASRNHESYSESPTRKQSSSLAPKESKLRTWEDRSGSFKVEAEFLGVVEGKVHLHKANGVKIAVAAPKLSLADLEYVERVTGMSLEAYKSKKSTSGSGAEDERERRERKERERKRRERDEREHQKVARERDERNRDRYEREQDRAERERDREERDRLRKELEETKKKLDEKPPPKPERPESSTTSTTSTIKNARSNSRDSDIKSTANSDYDWFELFLEAGVDVNQCQRYTTNFQREQIDPSIIESIDASVLRTLGLREGDIIRVTRYLDKKFNREPLSTNPTGNGGLITDSSGALKVNRAGSINKVGDSLPSPIKSTTPAIPTAGTDDDAWTVRPAVNNELADKPLQSQFTGSMHDLISLKPLQPVSTSSSAKIGAVPSPKPLEPVRTGPTGTTNLSSQPTGAVSAQPTGLVPLDPFKTGGNILPLTTGNFVYLPIQPAGTSLSLQKTGTIAGIGPIAGLSLQPTGLVPLQKTGSLPPSTSFVSQPTGLIPLQKTGGFPPPTTFGTQQTGLIPLQQTGGLPPVSLQKTGQLINPSLTGGLPQTTFGAVQTSFGALNVTGGLPTSSFGQQQAAFGAGLSNQNLNVALQPQLTQPQLNTFQQTGGFGPQPTFNTQQTSSLNQFANQPTGFNSTFNGQQPPLGSQISQLTSQFNNASLQTYPFGQQQQQQSFQPGFEYQQPFQTGFQQQQPFQTGFQQQQPFQTGFQQQQPLNGFQQRQPFESFQQQQSQLSFGGSTQQPLEAQPTGFGFGNSSTQSNTAFGSTGGQRANLANASAENPFGF
ncbi:hypothetical protein WICMUC_002953 [Wickerhamomyces mucosus]|uniref:Actin cytoskeleton-regulatory complex protein SLA1 n=1 Tax=Wickerhamomyces mucosus TaxID=1378264 RepID=A0A9P8PMM9_9ASCO|nr:hypothetical protein WICMUC_002953 [Wickerhamomyces mucosus]